MVKNKRPLSIKQRGGLKIRPPVQYDVSSPLPPPPSDRNLLYSDIVYEFAAQEGRLMSVPGFCPKKFHVSEWLKYAVPDYVTIPPLRHTPEGPLCVTCDINNLPDTIATKGSPCCITCEFWYRENILFGGGLEGLDIRDIRYGCHHQEMFAVMKHGGGCITPGWSVDLIERKINAQNYFQNIYRFDGVDCVGAFPRTFNRDVYKDVWLHKDNNNAHTHTHTILSNISHTHSQFSKNTQKHTHTHTHKRTHPHTQALISTSVVSSFVFVCVCACQVDFVCLCVCVCVFAF
eukprot:GHVR01119230.1.p1 GENE.GHVR01119230.1~~GHVR01119230.1.p1  ORF type:complete len:289 (+),score=107.85 GHVR01119230.1:144-1010(+)